MFDSALDRYQLGVRAFGLPDLSRGKPYNPHRVRDEAPET
jgi:hypothetical protein